MVSEVISIAPSEEPRTKLSAKAPLFRPLFSENGVGSSSTVASSGPSQGYTSDSLDISTGSVGSWTSQGQFVANPALCAMTSPSQGGGKGEFRLAEFRSKLLQRAQAAQSVSYQEKQSLSVPVGFQNNWSGDAWIKHALMVESFEGKGPRSSTEAVINSERRNAMNKCLQPENGLESKRGLAPIPLKHAASFTEGAANDKETKENPDSLPVKRTFIHFTPDEGPNSARFHSRSCPAIVSTAEGPHTKWPSMEKAHISGECRPCFYMTKKMDGCRLGADCSFCHLCPLGSVAKKRKEKIKAMREQETQHKTLRESRRQAHRRAWTSDSDP